MATEQDFVWTDQNLACVAAYNILEGDDQLNLDAGIERGEGALDVAAVVRVPR
jgi:hypothetical protein